VGAEVNGGIVYIELNETVVGFILKCEPVIFGKAQAKLTGGFHPLDHFPLVS